MSLLHKAVIKHALGSSPSQTGAPAVTAPAPQPTATPKLPTSTGPSLGTANLAAQRFATMRSNPGLPTSVPKVPAPVQSAEGTQITNQARAQLKSNPSGYMQAANASGPMGGLMAAGGAINADAMKQIFSGPAAAPEQSTNWGAAGNAMLGGADDLSRSSAMGANAVSLLGRIPGLSTVASKIPGLGRVGSMLGVTGKAAPYMQAVNGALVAGQLGTDIVGTAKDLWNGDTRAAGQRWNNDEYNQQMADTSKPWYSRTWDAMSPWNATKNLGGVAYGLFDGDTWRGLGLQTGLIEDNQDGSSGGSRSY